MSISSVLAVSMMIGTVLRARICAAHVEAVQPRQHHVQHHEVEAVLAQPVERLASVERRDHVVALLAQRVGEQLLDGQLVVHEQDAGCRAVNLRDCRLAVVTP